MLSSWLEVRFQILSLLPQCFSNQLAPGSFAAHQLSSPHVLGYTGNSGIWVGLDFTAGAEDLDAAETNLCVLESCICTTLFSPAMGHML